MATTISSLLFVAALSGQALGQSNGYALSGLGANDSVTFYGAGWGHGVGISQYGIKSRSLAGHTASQMLGFYYPNTTLEHGWGVADLRILLSTVEGGSRFRPRGPFEISIDGTVIYSSAGTDLFTVRLDGGIWTATNSGGANLCPAAGCTGSVFRISTADGVAVETSATRRSYSHGQIELSKLSNSAYRAVLASLNLEDYLKGIAEVPASWPTEALRAQAIAARSYALNIASTRRADSGWTAPFDLYSTVYDQVYAGNDKEAAPSSGPWLKAVADTSGQVLTYGGQPALTFYAASNGGYTEAGGYAFRQDLPYLIPTPDPHTDADPFKSWSVTHSVASLSRWLNRYSDTSVGTLQGISVTGNISPSGRINRATVHLTGSYGTKRVSGGRFTIVINVGARNDGLPELPASNSRKGHLLSTRFTFGETIPGDLPPVFSEATSPAPATQPPSPAPAVQAPSPTPTTKAPSPISPPGPPQGLQITPGAGEILLRWISPKSTGGGSLAYAVTWQSTGGSPRTQETTATSLRIEQLTNGVPYAVSVTARNEAGSSAAATVSGTPLGPPDPPVGASLSRGDGYLDLTWGAPERNGGSRVTSYEVIWQAKGGSSQSAVTTSMNHRIEGLTNGVTYSVAITARNDQGSSPQTAPIQMIPARPPGPPAGIYAEGRDGYIHVHWLPPNDNGGLAVRTYLLAVSTATESTTHEIPASSTSYDIEGLANGTTYAVNLRASNELGQSQASSSVSAKPAGPPGTPQNVHASRGDERISVSWQSPTYNGGVPIEGYEVSWKPSDEAEAPKSSKTLPATSTDFVIGGLANGVTYSISVAAINEVGASAPTKGESVTPAGIPGAPEELTLSRGDGSIEVTWASPEDDGGIEVIGYTVTWAPLYPDGSQALPPATADITEPGYEITGLKNGIPHAVTVSALNEIGGSVSSEELRAIPMATPGAPSEVEVILRPDSIAMTWDPPEEDGGGSVISYTIAWVPLAEDASEVEESAKERTLTDTSFIITDIEVGTTYRITLVANNEAGPSRFVAVTEAAAAPGETATSDSPPVEGAVALHDSLQTSDAERLEDSKVESATLAQSPQSTKKSSPIWSNNKIASLTLALMISAACGLTFWVLHRTNRQSQHAPG